MKYDLLHEEIIDRRNGGIVNHQLERGRLTGLMFTTTSTFHQKDLLTIKLRKPNGQTIMIADDVSVGDLAQLSDFKRGLITKGMADTPDGDDNELTAEVQVRQKNYSVDAFELPIGHLTLQDSQLQITIKVAKAFGNVCNFKVYRIMGPMDTDVVYQYDTSTDFEAFHAMVREIYLVSRGQQPGQPLGNYSFFNYEGYGTPGTPSAGLRAVAKDIKIRLEYEGENNTFDVDGMGAATAIFGSFATPPNTLLSVYADGDALPTPKIHVKVSGADAKIGYLLVIKEHRDARMAVASNIANAETQIARTQALEKTNPDQAAAARAAEVTARSSDLVQELRALPKTAV